jgi:uncharacterized protein YebE (UPF0316 family)
LTALSGLDVYALGFAAGNYVGSLVEERMAVGFATVQVISLTCTDTMVEEMRKEGFGVTVIEGCGKEGLHEILNVLVRRKDLSRLMDIVHKLDARLLFLLWIRRKLSAGFLPAKKTNKPGEKGRYVFP